MVLLSFQLNKSVLPTVLYFDLFIFLIFVLTCEVKTINIEIQLDLLQSFW